MALRGVHFAKKLEEFVQEGADMFSFPPMHSRDYSHVQRLAAIYRLRSSRRGSGKKIFVTVTRTKYTCMPSSSENFRLEQLIEYCNEDAHFLVTDVSNQKAASGNKKRTRKTAKSEASDSKQISKKKFLYAYRPVSFVSSGFMHSDALDTKWADSGKSNDTTSDVSCLKGFYSKIMAKIQCKVWVKMVQLWQSQVSWSSVLNHWSWVFRFLRLEGNKMGITSKKAQKPKHIGAFEKYTKGFGSKMMARLGYVEGRGLGKDGQGMTEPIGVVKRPKYLGLGFRFSETSGECKMGNTSKKTAENATKHIGAFEKQYQMGLCRNSLKGVVIILCFLFGSRNQED